MPQLLSSFDFAPAIFIDCCPVPGQQELGCSELGGEFVRRHKGQLFLDSRAFIGGGREVCADRSV